MKTRTLWLNVILLLALLLPGVSYSPAAARPEVGESLALPAMLSEDEPTTNNTPTALSSIPEWTWQNPLPQGNTLQAVWGSGPNDVFAVGSYGTILHYDGIEWQVMDSGTTQNLNGVWGSSGADVFAVGSGGTILHYDGAIWHPMSSGTTRDLNGVWGSSTNNVFAVGSNGTIRRYDGSLWRSMSSGTTNTLNGIWGSAANDIFVVGDKGTIRRYDGSVWRALSSNTSLDLLAVWGSSSSNVFAVGDLETVLYYNGYSWAVMTSGYSHGVYSGVWGTSSSNVYVTRTFCDVLSCGGTIIHYDGNTWNSIAAGPARYLSGVWGSSSSDIFVVGNGGTVLHYDGSLWTCNPGYRGSFTAIWGANASQVWAFDFYGYVLHYNGASWPTTVSQTGVLALYDAWGNTSNDIFAVGGYDVGIVHHFNGYTWSAMDISMASPFVQFYAVWGRSGSDVFAVGSGGTILHYNGTQWSAMTSNTNRGLYDVWGSDDNHVFAVGDYGTILRYDGSNWYAMSSGTTMTLRGVWGTGPNNVFAVGGSYYDRAGVILHYDGITWREVYRIAENWLNSIWGSNSDNIFAVGAGGAILHYDGSTWRAMNSGTNNTLHDAWGSGPNNVYAVGEGGTILWYRGRPCSISGQVRDYLGTPLSNVIISVGSSISTTTDTNGFYTLAELFPGDYTLTASKPSWAFDPPTRAVTLDSDMTGQDFTGIDVSAVISAVEYLAIDTNARLNQLLAASQNIAEDGDYFAIARQEDQIKLVADAIVDSAGVLAAGVDSVETAKDMIKMNFPGAMGRGWGHIISLRTSYEPARDVFREALLQPVTAANASRAAKEFVNGAHIYYAMDLLDAAAEDRLYDGLLKLGWLTGLQSDLALQNELYPANEELVSIYVQDLGSTTFHTQDNIPFMLPDAQATYIEDLTRRSQANIVMATTLERRALPLHLARAARESAEDAWIEMFLAKYLIKQLLYLWADGPGVLVAELGSWAFDLYRNNQRLQEDIRMMHLAIEGMSGALTSENRVYLNTVHGMDNIVTSIEPQIARGNINTITNESMGEYKLFGRWWWCERSAYSDLEIENTSTYPAVYQVLADYGKTGFLGTSYEPLVSEGVESIPGSDTDVLRVYYKQDDVGVSPDAESAIEMKVLGSTDTGTYYVTSAGTTWEPTRVTALTTRATLQNQEDALTIPYPIRTRIAVDQENLTYVSSIWIDNPFTQTVDITLTQQIPANVQIVDANTGNVSDDTLNWYTSLDPQTTREITHTFEYQGSAGQNINHPEPLLTMTDLSATAQVTFSGETEPFRILPPLSGVGIPPARTIRGDSISIPITVTNRLASQIISGTVRLELVDFINGIEIYSDAYPVTLAGGTQQTLTMELDTSAIVEGDYLLSTYVESNGGTEEIFTEYFVLRNPRVYLPLVMCRR